MVKGLELPHMDPAALEGGDQPWGWAVGVCVSPLCPPLLGTSPQAALQGFGV